MNIRRIMVAVIVAGILLLSVGGAAMAAGKLGGAGGADEFRTFQDGPALAAGKLGGVTGEDIGHSVEAVESSTGLDDESIDGQFDVAGGKVGVDPGAVLAGGKVGVDPGVL